MTRTFKHRYREVRRRRLLATAATEALTATISHLEAKEVKGERTPRRNAIVKTTIETILS